MLKTQYFSCLNKFMNLYFLAYTEPLKLASENVTTTSFCISFDSPINNTQNGPITSYIVTYQGVLFNTKQVTTTVSVSPVVYPLKESSSVCISNLEEYDNYTVSIRAVNGAGEGTAGMITVQTLEAGLLINFIHIFVNTSQFYIYLPSS